MEDPRAPQPPVPPPDPERLLRKLTAWGRRPRHGEDEDLLQPHATAPCSSCRCHFPPRAGGLMMEDPPSSLHRRRRCRFYFCFCCPLAHAIGGGLGAEEWSTSMDPASIDLRGGRGGGRKSWSSTSRGRRGGGKKSRPID
ncbi:uncharacterized protein [Aegilops tauschii subsp. strangulata]|uniref:uncharacterized protein n=1 Tax=Aegilops tauschii subsp. strangulata TaxID=200361 RepID=UPI00098A6DB5|nr:uncharacterized protein LOC109756227 [Aegilops tauschii subsp. strangulata]XP_044358743.1 uncharacterized protein LOC123079966 [Triticum aestivum]